MGRKDISRSADSVGSGADRNARAAGLYGRTPAAEQRIRDDAVRRLVRTADCARTPAAFPDRDGFGVVVVGICAAGGMARDDQPADHAARAGAPFALAQPARVADHGVLCAVRIDYVERGRPR